MRQVVVLLIVALCGCNRESATTAPPLPGPLARKDLPSTSSPPTSNLLADDWFEDVTERTGIRFVPRNGREARRYYLVESFGSGVALVDYDRDLQVDVFLTGGGTISAPPAEPAVGGLPSALFRNLGGLRFSDATEPSGFSQAPDYSLGCTVTDFDVDGFPDVFVACYGRSRLYRNLGDGSFAESTGEELPATGMATAAAFADVDRDGFPDLFLARYVPWSPAVDVQCFSKVGVRDVCGPSQYEANTSLFFRNCGDGRFEDRSGQVGLKGGTKGLGLLAGDFDDDGLVDVYLANDETANHLYWGTPEGTLLEGGWPAGVAADDEGIEEGSMGVDAGDLDGNGQPELWVVNYEDEDNSLYRSVGKRAFRHATVAMGLGGVSRMRVGWGTSLTDFDGDGWLDILVLNGHAVYSSDLAPYLQKSQLFRNLGGRRFEDVSDKAGRYFRQAHAARGNAVGDLDGDGAPDLVASHINEPVRILRNRKPPASFLSLRLCATHGDPAAIGAKVTVEAGGRSLVRFVMAGRGYASHSDDRILIPLPDEATPPEVTVRWPGRGTDVFRGLPIRGFRLLLEGSGESDER